MNSTFQGLVSGLSFVAGIGAAKLIYWNIYRRWPNERREGCPDELQVFMPWKHLSCGNCYISTAGVILWLFIYAWLIFSLFVPSVVSHVVTHVQSWSK